MPPPANSRAVGPSSWAQRSAMKVWDEGGDFQEYVAADQDIARHLSPVEIERVFSLDTYLRNIDAIFARVFQE